MPNDTTYCGPRNKPANPSEQESKAHAEAVRIIRLHEARIARPFEHAYTASNYLHGIRDRLSKREIAYLSAIIPLLRRKHWRLITQRAIATRCGWDTRSVKRAQADLIDKGIIAVSHQYQPIRANRKRPSRRASVVWLIGYSREHARYIDCREFDDVEPHNFLASLSPAARLEIGAKVPPKNRFHRGQKSSFIGDRLSPYSFIDSLQGEHKRWTRENEL